MKKIALVFSMLIYSSVLFAEHTSILFRGANVFDGKQEKLIMDVDVLVEGNTIKTIGKDLASEGATVIDASGKTLMRGLIDVHWHTYYAYAPVSTLATGDMSEVAILGFLGAEQTLMRGFTTVRDVGGNPFAVKK